nr:DUF1302 family protein [uncultured Sphaerochaeta sp.]
MKHKTFILTSIIFAIFLLPAAAGDGVFSGMVRDYATFRFSQTDMPVHEMTADLRYDYYGGLGKLTLHPVAYSNPNEGVELDLQEAYFDFYLQDADLRVGKQKIIWGEAEGAFITDLVSPRDMRSFILADFTEIRKAVPAIKVDYYAGDYTLQGIWVTHFIPSTLPSQNSMWAQAPSLPFPPTVTAEIQAPFMPDSSLKNSEAFLSLGRFGNKISWKVNGGYVFTDEPLVTGVTAPTATTREISQGYERYGFVGGSFNTTLGSVVLRGEAALALEKPFNSVDTTSNPPISIEYHNQVQTLVGLDWNMLGAQWSSQYLLTYTHDHSDSLVSQMKPIKEFAHTLTFRVQDTFLDERLTAKLFTYVELEPTNALIRPSLSYNFGDGVLIEGGVELFVGDEEGTFGVYQDNSMAWAALRWYF